MMGDKKGGKKELRLEKLCLAEKGRHKVCASCQSIVRLVLQQEEM
jgi:hypothetical protein